VPALDTRTRSPRPRSRSCSANNAAAITDRARLKLHTNATCSRGLLTLRTASQAARRGHQSPPNRSLRMYAIRLEKRFELRTDRHTLPEVKFVEKSRTCDGIVQQRNRRAHLRAGYRLPPLPHRMKRQCSRTGSRASNTADRQVQPSARIASRSMSSVPGRALQRVRRLLPPPALARAGNQGDIDLQSIAGATATATHGTGARFASRICRRGSSRCGSSPRPVTC
jgi:hypothetical protein